MPRAPGLLRLVAPLLLLVACAGKEDEGGFGANGSSGVDDGGGDDGGGAESTAPEVTDLQVVIVDFPNSPTGWGVELRAAYEDPDDNIVGGSIYIRMKADGEVVYDGEEPITGDAGTARIEEGQVKVLFDGGNPNYAYEAKVRLTDDSGYESGEVTATYEPSA